MRPFAREGDRRDSQSRGFAGSEKKPWRLRRTIGLFAEAEPRETKAFYS